MRIPRCTAAPLLCYLLLFPLARTAAQGVGFSISGRMTRTPSRTSRGIARAGVRLARTITASVNPSLEIPDEDAIGVESVISISDPGTIFSVERAVRVSVDITHPFIGDLEVTLIHPDGTETLLHKREAAGAQELVTTYPDETEPFQTLIPLIGRAAGGDWKLRVRDLDPLATGRLNGWSLTLSVLSAPLAITGQSGRYAISGLPPGVYTVVPSHRNHVFSPDSRTVTVGPGGSRTNFITSRRFSINGLVLADVAIKAVAATGRLYQTHAAPNGQYEFSDLPPGVYTVTPYRDTRARDDRFNPESQTLELGPSQTLPLFGLTDGLRHLEPPTHLATAGISNDEVNLTWSYDGSEELGFVIERRVQGGRFRRIAILRQNTTTYTDNRVTPGTTYSYRVAAFNAFLISKFTASAGAMVPPTAGF